jgi:hypothetical protein
MRKMSGRRKFRRIDADGENIKLDFKEICVRMWTGFIWHTTILWALVNEKL